MITGNKIASATKAKARITATKTPNLEFGRYWAMTNVPKPRQIINVVMKRAGSVF